MSVTPEATQPPGRRGRRWSLDAAMLLFNPPEKPPARTKRNRSSSVVGPESIFVPPSLTEKSHHSFLDFPHKIQKNFKKLQRRHSLTSPQKDFIIVVKLDDGTTQILTGSDGRSVRDVLNSARRMELKINSYRVIMSSSRSTLPSFTASMSMSESLEDLFEEFQDGEDNEQLLATDGRYASFHNLLESERIYQQNLRTIFDTYAEPLRKFSALSREDHRVLFSGIEPILSLSNMLSSKVEDALRQWDPGTAYLGSFFSKKFWEQYEDYISGYRTTAEYLREKRRSEESFSEFCDLRQGSADQSIEELLFLPVRRIPRYEQHLRDLQEVTDPNHPDFEDISRALDRVKEMVVEHDVIGDGGTEMESIQDRFPNDDLQLNRKDQPLVHNLHRRRRSAPSALLFKTLGSSRARSAGNLLSSTGSPFKKEDCFQSTRLMTGRYFVKEGAVQLAPQGVQSQERYLFLFNDVLLIAKQKSGNTYKLKQRVRVCNLWTSSCVEDLDLSRCPQHSFVIGWPLTNQIISCSNHQDKLAWLLAINSQIEEERKKFELRTITVNVNSGDDLDQMKEIDISVRQDAKEILKIYVDKCHISESDAKDYQLWVMPGREDSAFPLIGHEIPYSICCPGDETEQESTQWKFFVKNKKVSKRQSMDEGRKQKGKTFLSLFKRSSRDSLESGHSTKLFGQPLESVMVDEELPKPVMTLLTMLCRHGPQTHGILRKSANDRLKKDLKQRLEDGEECITDETASHIVGALVKDYLRSLPDSLLMDDLYEEWLGTDSISDHTDRINAIKQLSGLLPHCNTVLLKHVMCILYHIEKHSEWSSMNASNLAICMAQSLLYSKGTGTLQPSQVMKANNLLQFMIENCVEIFGEEMTMLLEFVEDKQDSGTDTDSIPETNGNLRRDDSSLDSLEKDDPPEMESGSRLAKSHLSPVNLSNDSGVTLSDNQLVSDEGPYNDHRNHNLIRHHHHNSHVSVSKRCSADSLCSVEESSELEERYQHRSYDPVSLSSNRDHLYPSSRNFRSTEALSDSEIQTRPRERLVRQSSVISSTPPLSPQPKLSYSSDSLLSDSSASYLRESGVEMSGDSPRHVFPGQTYHQSFSQTITVDHDNSNKRLEKSNSDDRLPFSKHPPPQRRYSDESIHYGVSPPSSPHKPLRNSSPPPLSPPWRPISSSKTNHRHSVHSYLSPQGDIHLPKDYNVDNMPSESHVHSSKDYEVHMTTPALSLAEINVEDCTDGLSKPSWKPSADKLRFAHTQPPRILLQTYCQSHHRDHEGNASDNSETISTLSNESPPLRPLMESRTVSVTRKQHNVIKIKSKSATPANPINTKPQYLSQVTIKPRPQHPPSYLEALDRKERISKGLPVDVTLQDTISQKKASAHAKQLYQQSLKQFIKETPNPVIKTSFSSSSSSEEEFHPEKDPKKVYEASMKQFLEQQSSNSSQLSGMSRSRSVGIVKSQSHTHVTVVPVTSRSTLSAEKVSENRPDHRTVIHIPSVRDSKLVEMRKKGIPSVSNSYSRTARHSLHNPTGGCFYHPKSKEAGNAVSRVSVSHQRSVDSKYHSSSNLSPLSTQNNSGLSWSVADLRRNYQKTRSEPAPPQSDNHSSQTVSVDNPLAGGTQGNGERPPPPPYHHPPPFRRNSDTARESSFSSSSTGSSDGSGSSTSHTIRNNYSPQHL